MFQKNLVPPPSNQDGHSMFLRNVGTCIPHHMESHPKDHPTTTRIRTLGFKCATHNNGDVTFQVSSNLQKRITRRPTVSREVWQSVAALSSPTLSSEDHSVLAHFFHNTSMLPFFQPGSLQPWRCKQYSFNVGRYPFIRLLCLFKFQVCYLPTLLLRLHILWVQSTEEMILIWKKKCLSQCYCVYQKSLMDWPVKESGPQWWKTGL
jgi:hypothetical protein